MTYLLISRCSCTPLFRILPYRLQFVERTQRNRCLSGAEASVLVQQEAGRRPVGGPRADGLEGKRGRESAGTKPAWSRECTTKRFLTPFILRPCEQPNGGCHDANNFPSPDHLCLHAVTGSLEMPGAYCSCSKRMTSSSMASAHSRYPTSLRCTGSTIASGLIDPSGLKKVAPISLK